MLSSHCSSYSYIFVLSQFFVDKISLFIYLIRYSIAKSDRNSNRPAYCSLLRLAFAKKKCYHKKDHMIHAFPHVWVGLRRDSLCKMKWSFVRSYTVSSPHKYGLEPTVLETACPLWRKRVNKCWFPLIPYVPPTTAFKRMALLPYPKVSAQR